MTCLLGWSANSEQRVRSHHSGTRRGQRRPRIRFCCRGRQGQFPTDSRLQKRGDVFRAPDDVVDAGRRLPAVVAARWLSAIVHDTIVVEIGCSRVPLFSMVCGDEAVHSFHSSVYSAAPRVLTSEQSPTLTSSSVWLWAFRTVAASPISYNPAEHTRHRNETFN